MILAVFRQTFKCTVWVFELMEKAIDYNVDYFAFCDQDDVWDEDKLKIGVEKLELNQDGKPALYYYV